MKAVALAVLTLAVAGCATTPPVLGPPLANHFAPHEIAATERQVVITIRDMRPTLRTTPGSTARVYGSSTTYRRTAHAQRVIDGLAKDYSLDWVTDWRIDLIGVHCAVFRAPADADRDALVSRLNRDARVESVQPMHLFRTHSRVGEYNDPYFPLQKGIEAMRVPQAHQWSRGRNVSVAIIDTGADIDHPELAGRVQLARNFVDTDSKAFHADRHGTAVAGVIAALTDNGTGIIGVAPGARLQILKACWQVLTDHSSVCNTLTLAEAISFAIRSRVQVINLSLGGPSDPLLTRLLEEAVKRGIIVVGARPSSAARGESPGFPIDVDGVLAVADADEPDAGETQMSPGAATVSPLAAPGREVLTLVPGQRYDYVSGASISAALVSGVVALVLERRNGMPPSQIHALLERTARANEHRVRRVVDACDAVATLMRDTTTCMISDPTRIVRAQK